MGKKHVIFIAAENGAIPGGKVGGVGDVIRDMPAALAEAGWQATILTPSYGVFHELPDVKFIGTVDVAFRTASQAVEIFEIPGSQSGVRNIAFEHPNFSPLGRGHIYSSDDPERPFATDANKFAFFGATAAAWISQLDNRPNVVHLHDWHAAFYLLLRDFAPEYQELRNIRTVFTIHNLSYQGTRPLRGDVSSLEHWFPGLDYDQAVVRDPLRRDCINPIALAIRAADMISTVSPTYAREIRRPSDTSLGFIGGEGLECVVDEAAQDGRVVGILNGCEYDDRMLLRPNWQQVVALAKKQVDAWLASDPRNDMHRLATERLDALPEHRPEHTLVSIGRLVKQKVSLFFEELPDGHTALEEIAEKLGPQGVLIVLGSGELHLERQMLDITRRCEQLIFLRGYSESLAELLYRAGDLFLMPSSFEPCGISQMLAMRAGQPCVVHGVGGLRDTVSDDSTGFVFYGGGPTVQATNFVTAVQRALALKTNDRKRWQKLCDSAASQRFEWPQAVLQTVRHLYGFTD